MNSETLFSGLFSMLTPLGPSPGNGTFATVGRRLQFVDQMSATTLPAVFQNQITRNPALGYTMDALTFEDFQVDWYVYAFVPNQTQPTTPVLNPLVDAVLGVLPLPGQQLLINGHALAVHVSGPIQYTEGLLGNYAVARIPLHLRADEGLA